MSCGNVQSFRTRNGLTFMESVYLSFLDVGGLSRLKPETS